MLLLCREFLFTKLLSISPSAYDKNFLSLLFSFSLRSISAHTAAQIAATKTNEFQFVPDGDTKAAGGGSGAATGSGGAGTALEQNEFGIRLFWKAIQYDAGVPAAIQALALGQLKSALLSLVGQKYRDTYMALCVQNLSDKKSVSPALRVLSFILESFPETTRTSQPFLYFSVAVFLILSCFARLGGFAAIPDPTKPATETPSAHGITRSEVISSLQNRFNLLRLLFQDLATYKKSLPSSSPAAAASTVDTKLDTKSAAPPTPTTPSAAPSPTAGGAAPVSGQAEIDSRLEFLRFVLKNSKLALQKYAPSPPTTPVNDMTD